MVYNRIKFYSLLGSSYASRGLEANLDACGLMILPDSVAHNISSFEAISNKKQDSFRWWDFYGVEQYKQSMTEIKEILSQRFLPFIRRMEYDPMAIISEVAEKGFCVFADEPEYDAGFVIPTAFLLRYGTHEHLTMAFQNYIDRYQLPYVKTNMEKAISLLKENKEVVNNGEKYYAEFVVNHNIELKF